MKKKQFVARIFQMGGEARYSGKDKMMYVYGIPMWDPSLALLGHPDFDIAVML